MQTVNAPTEPSSAGEVKQRLSRALFELNLKLASCKSGALVQVGRVFAFPTQCSSSICCCENPGTNGGPSHPAGARMCLQIWMPDVVANGSVVLSAQVGREGAALWGA